MADLRKLFLALIAGALLFATVASAQGNYQCDVSAAPTTVRSEGLAELMGDMLLNCAGPVPATGVVANIRLRLTTNITSNLLTEGGVTRTDSLLILEPSSGYRAYGAAFQNVYQAYRTSDREIEWREVVIAAAGSAGPSVMRITNVRGNARMAGEDTQIIAQLFVEPSSAIVFNQNGITVAETKKGLTFGVDDNSFRNCEEPTGTIKLQFTEGFSGAFRPKLDAPDFLVNSVPGGGYLNESGFTPPLSAGTLVGAEATFAVASQGTRLMATVADIPDGVTLQVPIQVTTDEGMVLQLVVDGDMVLGTGTEELDGDTVVYEVYSITQESFGNPETVEIEVGIDYDVPGPLGTATVKGTFAPLSTIQTMNASAPEPRFADTGEAKTFLEIGPCRTILLFPFVTNQAGFDTGIAIANTSADPMGTTNQAGVCKLNYYGNTNAGAAPAVQTSPSVPAGGHLVFALSGGGGVYAPNGGLTACAAGNCVAPLFQGYVFAICEFQFAHGYAFISDLGATKLAQGYLALVVPDRGDRLPQANSCGNGALSLGETDGTYECTDTNQGEQLNN